MKESPPRQSHGPSFVAIYLIITVAVVAAIITLKPAPEEISLTLPDEQNIIKKDMPAKPSPVPQKKRNPNPPLPRPIPSLTKTETTDKTDSDAPQNSPDNNQEKAANDPAAGTEAVAPAGPALTAEQEKEIEQLYPFPKIRPLMEIVDDWRNVPQSAIPKLVAIRKPISFDMSQGGSTVARGKLPAGSMMVPVRLVGENEILLKTAGSAPITATIPVADTDFRESIQKRYDRYVEQARNKVIAQREAERTRILGAAMQEVELTGWNDGADSRFDPAKLSLQRGEVGTYSLPDAAKWRWGGSETVDGEQYDTVFVLMVTKAAFGEDEKELKVFLQGNQVVRWLDPATGQAI